MGEQAARLVDPAYLLVEIKVTGVGFQAVHQVQEIPDCPFGAACQATFLQTLRGCGP